MSGEVVKSKLVQTTNATGIGVGTNTCGVAATSDHAFSITGTFVGTIIFEASIDNGLNWFPCSLRDAAAVTDGARVLSTTVVGLFFGDVAVYSNIRAKCTAYTSGTAVIKGCKAYR